MNLHKPFSFLEVNLNIMADQVVLILPQVGLGHLMLYVECQVIQQLMIPAIHNIILNPGNQLHGHQGSKVFHNLRSLLLQEAQDTIMEMLKKIVLIPQKHTTINIFKISRNVYLLSEVPLEVENLH